MIEIVSTVSDLQHQVQGYEPLVAESELLAERQGKLDAIAFLLRMPRTPAGKPQTI
jgi:hypothetical protein